MWEWLIFVLVFFLYVHIVHQYQSSEESDIYEYDYVDNTNLPNSNNIQKQQNYIQSQEHSQPKNQQSTIELHSKSRQSIKKLKKIIDDD